MRLLSISVLLSIVLGCGGDDDTAPRDAGGGGDGGSVDSAAGGDGASSDGGASVDAGSDGGASAGTWASYAPLAATAQELASDVIDGRIYVAGGFESASRVVDTLRIYDPTTDAWSEGPALPTTRHHAGLVALGGDLYLIGGMVGVGFTAVDTCFVLRAGATTWEPIASLPVPRAAAAAGAIDGRIVVAAGQGGGSLLEPALVYDPAMDAWTEGAAIPTPREHVAGFVHAGELWVLGGRRLTLSTNTDVVEIYDPATDAWRTGPAMPTEHGGFGAAVLDGAAYVVGGEQPDRALDTVEALDLARGTWTTLTPVPTPRHGHAVAAAAGRVWVIGGADVPIFGAVDVVEAYTP